MTRDRKKGGNGTKATQRDKGKKTDGRLICSRALVLALERASTCLLIVIGVDAGLELGHPRVLVT